MPSSDAINKMLQNSVTTTNKPSEKDNAPQTNNPSLTSCPICALEKRTSCKGHGKSGGGGDEADTNNTSSDSVTPTTNEDALLEANPEIISLQLTARPTDSPTPIIEDTDQLTLKPGVSLKAIEDELNEFIKTLAKELNLDENATLENSETSLGISCKNDGKQLTINFSNNNYYERFMQQLAEKNLVNLPSESKQHTAQPNPKQHIDRQEADKENAVSGAPNPFNISITPTPYN